MIVKEAVNIEKKLYVKVQMWINSMNDDLMSQYIEFVADRLVTQLGYKDILRMSIFIYEYDEWMGRQIFCFSSYRI